MHKLTAYLLVFVMLASSLAFVVGPCSMTAEASSTVTCPAMAMDGYILDTEGVKAAYDSHSFMDVGFEPDGRQVRGYMSFDISAIPDGAVVESAQLYFYTSAEERAFRLYSADLGDSLDVGDWGAGIDDGTFIAEVFTSVGYSGWRSVDISAGLTGEVAQFELVQYPETYDPLNYYTCTRISTSESASKDPYVVVQYRLLGSVVFDLSDSSQYAADIVPTVQDYNSTAQVYIYEFDTWTGVDSVTISKGAANWGLLAYTPSCTTLTETDTSVTLAGVIAGSTYRVYLTVPFTQQSSVYVSYYMASTGEGFPFETFRVKWSSGLTYDNTTALDMTSSTMTLPYGGQYTIAVLDYFGNVIATKSFVANAAQKYIAIPLDVHSFKVFNQQEDFVRFSIYYNGTGAALSFFCAPNEPVERFLRSGDYTVVVTYYPDATVGTSEFFDITVSDAEFLLVEGMTISRVVDGIEGVNALQQVITELVTPDMVCIKENMPTVPTEAVEYVHPWSVVTATTRQNGTGTSIAFNVPHPGTAGTIYTILEDRLYFMGAFETEVWVNDTAGANLYHSAKLPSSILLDGENITVEASNPVACERVSKWRGEDLFYYAYYTAQRRYEVTLNVNNSLGWGELKNIDWFIGFPENRSIDLSSVRIQDLDNALYLVPGLNYDVTQAGMRMSFDSLASGAARSFKFVFYDANASGGQGTAQAIIDTYDAVQYEGEGYYKGACSWTNSFTYAYSGSLTIALTFEKARYIDPSSIVVIDRMRDRKLLPNEFSYTGSAIVISSIEDVPISAVYGFEVYFLIDYEQSEKLNFMAAIPGIGVSPFVLMTIFAVVLTAAFVASYCYRMKHTGKLALLLAIYGSAVMLLAILSAQGML